MATRRSTILNRESRIYIAGHHGLVGSAICRALKEQGYSNLIVATHKQLELKDTTAVAQFFQKEKPEYVFLAAAKVGGIIANNTYRADFLYDNLMIQNNVIHQSYKSGIKKLLFLGSTCIYPKMAAQPMREDSLLTGPLEYTNEPYAVAKIAGIKLCESYNIQYGTDFISAMPTNLYGINDNFDLEKSHVLPALIRKMHLAKLLSEGKIQEVYEDLGVNTFAKAQEVLIKYGVTSDTVEIWGTGTPKREFLWSDDMADACIHLMKNVSFKDVLGSNQEIRNTHINIGTGEDVSIKELAFKIKDSVGFQGELVFNTDKPDGTPRKLTEVTKLHNLGWKHSIQLDDGIERLYKWYLSRNL